MRGNQGLRLASVCLAMSYVSGAAVARGQQSGDIAIPNFIHPDTPPGGEDDSRELRRVGEPRVFDFEPKDHLAIASDLDLLDFEARAKVTGHKFYFLKNEAVPA